MKEVTSYFSCMLLDIKYWGSSPLLSIKADYRNAYLLIWHVNGLVIKSVH